MSDISILSNDALIELGAQLENELTDSQNKVTNILEELERQQGRLIKPGVKLGLNTAGGIFGVAVAPITLGWSLLITIVLSGVTISDTIDFNRDFRKVLLARKKLKTIRTSVNEIKEQLKNIEELLEDRLG